MARKPKAEDTAAPRKNVSATAITDCMAEYEEMMGRRARLDAQIGAMFMKYEKAEGVDRAQVKRSYRRRNMDPAEVRSEIEVDMHYTRVLGQIEWDAKSGQGSFIEAIAAIPTPVVSKVADANLARARAHSDGYNSGKAGAKVGSCRFSVGSEQYVAWRDGWQDGTADREAVKPGASNVVKADARRERKGGAKAAAETPPIDPDTKTAGSA